MGVGNAYGGLVIADGGSGTQSLSTTAVVMNWGAASAADSNTYDGDPAVKPDVSNNRLLVLPGVYRVAFDISGTTGGATDIKAQVRKNGTVVSDLSGRGNISTTRGQISFEGILVVTAADAPKTIGTFADPASTGFAGAGGAPKTEVPVDVVLSTISGSPTLTVEAAHFTLTKLA